MASAGSESTDTTIRDSRTGRLVTVRGVGALKGHLTLRRNIDLTKPIAPQVVKTGKSRKAVAPAER